MSVTLSVETADLAAAAHTLSDHVGDRLWSLVGSALAEAISCTGMAGDDPAGLSWAVGYESAASGAAQAAQDVINGAFTLSGLLSTTAANYASADAASTIGERHAVDDVVADLPGPTTVTLGTRFAGVGGGPPNAPLGWSHVEHYVRAVWPNGHQDRLLRAAGAWRRSAGALDAGARDVDLALLEPLLDGLPEWRDIRTACWSLAQQLRGVAHAHRALAGACEQFAHHLDAVHTAVVREVEVFLAESLAIQAAGDALALFTLGLSEVVAQSAEDSRIAAALAAIIADLAAFGTAVREVVESLPLVGEISSRVSAAMHELLSVRVVVAEVAGVPGLRVLSIARDGRNAAAAADAGGELGAVTRLTDDATLPTELRAALDSPRSGEWNDPTRLEAHFRKHGGDFGDTSEIEYASRAHEFFERAVRDGLPTKVDGNGNIRIYDPTTNTFGSYASDGTTRTFFKPSSSTYWGRQKGEVVR